ncbi:DUF4431 domain-containing protein [Afipia sp. GAS231]|uniref:DUF4431 domain-containing protein n=1 Tax=Afipia sp. GAS231 TaxID=1882747 RepID=UPI00087D4DF6|nr:DUF4431 domain-containing protein [Afipia sp. GAS231]SDO07520.1 protein of unknown function [Afipia sp. GAS231]
MRLSVHSLRFLAALIVTLTGLNSGPARSACLDVKKESPVTFAGKLTFRIFGGPPYNGGVTKGDTPEPTYILKLDRPVCAEGDDFVDPADKIDSIQVFPEWDQNKASTLSERLRRLVGTRVRVLGKSAFGAHTGHHHAPLLLPITSVERDVDPTDAYDTAMTTVQGFYVALAAGSGDEAVAFLVPEKRRNGPFSADAITKFYGHLDEPLSLIDVNPVSSNEYRVRYTFVARQPKRCDGEAIVRTTRVQDENLISSIRALNGC